GRPAGAGRVSPYRPFGDAAAPSPGARLLSVRNLQEAMTEGLQTEIVVGVGDFRIARAPSRFLATYGLGSCVGVLLYDWRRQAGALLNVMMPDSSVAPERAKRQPFAYVDTAIPKMFAAVAKAGISPKRTRCCVIGGAAM